MEILVLLVVLAGVVALLSRPGAGKSRHRGQPQPGSKQTGRDRPTPREEQRLRLPPRAGDNRSAPAQRQTNRFDGQTAAPVSGDTVVEGKAFVIDGDSLVICQTQIRLFGVDAPELDHPYGRKAKWALATLCKGQVIRAEVTERDVHGRTVARCFLPDGRDLSAEMVQQGLAIDWPKFSGGKYRALERPDARRKLWLADARQKGRMHVWKQFEASQKARLAARS